MTDSKLRKLPDGRWAIAAPGLQPVPIAAGDVFEVQVGSKMRRVRMDPGGTAEGHVLREGLRARFSDGRERFAMPAKR